MIQRHDKRGPSQLRPVNIQLGFVKGIAGSCLYQQGNTLVLAGCTLQDGVPSFLKGKGTGWLTCEYNLLPYSCSTRINRDKISGRNLEIQRLVGRALRSCIDLEKLGERTLWIDCDVIQADGGTRTSCVNAGFLSLVQALSTFKEDKLIKTPMLTRIVGAVSVGIWKGVHILDLDYKEDSEAEICL